MLIAFEELNLASYYLQLPDVRIHYRRLGAGPTLVLLHGMGSCADDWFPITPALAHAFDLVLVDLRGHGLSSLPISGEYSLPNMAGDVVKVLDELGIERAHVLGLSLGGCVSLQMAVTYPERVQRLVLVNTFAKLRGDGLSTLAKRLSRFYIAMRDMDKLAEFIAASLFDDPDTRDFVARRMRRNDRRVILYTMLNIASFNLLPQLRGITCPTLVLTGNRDRTVPRRCAAEMIIRLPRAWLRTIEDAGHALPFDQPELFQQAVLRFLTGARFGAPAHL